MVPMSGRLVLADFRGAPPSCRWSRWANTCPYESPVLGFGVLRWLPWHRSALLDW